MLEKHGGWGGCKKCTRKEKMKQAGHPAEKKYKRTYQAPGQQWAHADRSGSRAD